EEWDLDDPAELDITAIRPIRDEIETRVRLLLTELDLPAN
ncbi:arsenate reductase ArsC, partial [Nocardia puris]|nr:arsenate reductase ArsC [Nocardia puris]